MKAFQVLTVLTLVLVGGFSFANEQGNAIPECQAPISACQAAGFKVGAHKKGDKEGTGIGLWVDCIDAVADGKKQVAGVDVSAAQACKAAKKAQKHSK